VLHAPVCTVLQRKEKECDSHSDAMRVCVCVLQLLSNHGKMSIRKAEHLFVQPARDNRIPLHYADEQ
jgi:hypothetical protein